MQAFRHSGLYIFIVFISTFIGTLISFESYAESEFNQYSHQDNFENFTIQYDDNIAFEMVSTLAKQVSHERSIVLGYLNQSKLYQGTPIKQPLVVIISKTKRSPYQDWNEIHIPEKRLIQAMTGKSGNGMALIHELTHVYAVSDYRKKIKNGYEDRFYDDGLAVFLQHRFGGVAEYPNFGVDLYRQTANLVSKHGQLIPLAKAEDARHESKTRVERQLAYVQEGAFTQFLIENYGLDAYLKIFKGEPVKTVTGKSVEMLELEWIEMVNLFN